jgi:hypothetical protein
MQFSPATSASSYCVVIPQQNAYFGTLYHIIKTIQYALRGIFVVQVLFFMSKTIQNSPFQLNGTPLQYMESACRVVPAIRGIARPMAGNQA